MKLEHIYIRANQNGYTLCSSGDGLSSRDNSWSFETIEAVQKALPDILELPILQRGKTTCECCKPGSVRYVMEGQRK